MPRPFVLPIGTPSVARPLHAVLWLALISGCSGSEGSEVRTLTRTVTNTVSAPCEATTWTIDGDGDGWGDGSNPVVACDPPAGAAPEGDCDDNDPSIHPDAVDSPLDDIDQDCSGEPATAPDCSDDGAAWIEGSLSFEGVDADAAMVEACTRGNRVAGDLLLNASDAPSMPILRCLCEVAGAVRILDNPELETVAAPALKRVGGDLEIGGAPALSQVDLSVEGIGGSLIVQDAPQLGDWSLEVEALQGDLVLARSGAQGFADLDLGAFDGSVRIDAVSWTHISLDVDGVDDLTLAGSPGLDTLDVDGPTDELDVQGDLIIQDNPVLGTLRLGGGLTSDLCISRVGGTLRLENNPLLDLGPPFGDGDPSCITEVGGDYIVMEQPQLGSLESLDPAHVGGDVVLADVDLSPTTNHVLRSTTSVGGSVRVARVDASDLLSVLTAVPGDLELDRLTELDTDALGHLLTVGGDLRIDRVHCAGCGGFTLSSLEQVDGDIDLVSERYVRLFALEAVGGDLVFTGTGQPPYTSYGGLTTGPAVVGGGVVLSQCDLSSSEFGVLSVGGDFDVLGSTGEPSHPFATTEVAGTVRLRDHGDGLADLHMFSALTRAEGLALTDNTVLSTLEGLDGLTSLPGDLEVSGNRGLVALDGLGNLASVSGSVTLESNPSLVDLHGLEHLAAIGGGLFVGSVAPSTGNDALERLDGLEGLRTVGELWLNHNHVLTDVTAAHGIETVYGGVLIQSNPSLATADAQALADAIPNKGVVSIVDNAP